MSSMAQFQSLGWVERLSDTHTAAAISVPGLFQSLGWVERLSDGAQISCQGVDAYRFNPSDGLSVFQTSTLCSCVMRGIIVSIPRMG